MAVYQCERCGANLSVGEGTTVVKCEYCDTVQTVSSMKNDDLQEILSHANSLHIEVKFDNTRHKNVTKNDDTLVKQARLNEIYAKGIERMNSAKTEEGYKAAAELFGQIAGHKDADERYEKCILQAEIIRKDSILLAGLRLMDIGNYVRALARFEEIPEWKFANQKAVECRQKIQQLKASVEAERIQAPKRAKHNLLLACVTLGLQFIFWIAGSLILNQTLSTSENGVLSILASGITMLIFCLPIIILTVLSFVLSSKGRVSAKVMTILARVLGALGLLLFGSVACVGYFAPTEKTDALFASVFLCMAFVNLVSVVTLFFRKKKE